MAFYDVPLYCYSTHSFEKPAAYQGYICVTRNHSHFSQKSRHELNISTKLTAKKKKKIDRTDLTDQNLLYAEFYRRTLWNIYLQSFISCLHFEA